MKTRIVVFTIIAIACFVNMVFAQVPQILNFQGQLQNSSGQPVPDGNYSILFAIYTVASGGTPVWNNGGQAISVNTKNGVFNALLSNVNLNFSAAEYYVGMKVGTDDEMTPRQRIVSVPYAINAAKVDGRNGGVAIRIHPGSTTNSAGMYSGFFHHDLLIGSFNEGSFSHGFISTGYNSSARKFSIGRASDGDFSIATFTPLFTIVDGTGNVGIGTAYPQYKLHVAGTMKVNGADLAEPFDMTNIDTLELGDVVVMDPANPKHLKKSVNAYDHKVAGIVSSSEQAGYVAGSRSDGSSDKPVALTGRVLCKVSAENGAIAVGDLLTTANTPGYAMKATDRDRAFGAVLGKALEAFEGDTGMILVLVALQ